MVSQQRLMGSCQRFNARIPEKWFERDSQRGAFAAAEGKRVGRVSFHPSGKMAAGLVNNPHGDLHIAVWDVATGKVQDSLVLRYLATQANADVTPLWISERQLLLSTGALVDLDWKTWAVRYEFTTWPGVSPDGRYWRLDRLPTEDRGYQNVIAATTIPDAETATQIAQAKQGFAWHPGQEVRLEIAGHLPDEEREATAAAVADTIAKRGFTINPKAKHAVRVNIGVDDGLVVGKSTPAVDPNYVIEEYEMGKVGNVRISVVDDQGEPMFASAGSIQTSSTFKRGGEKTVWVEMRQRLKRIEVPRTYFRDAAGKRLPLVFWQDHRKPIGIDGVMEAPPSTYTIDDRYGLPKDKAEVVAKN